MRPSLFAYLVILIWLLASPLNAQRPDTAGGKTDSARVPLFSLPPVIITGALAPTAPERLGMAVSTVSPRDLEVQPVLFAVDALRRLPSVSIDEANGPGGPTIVRLRAGEEVFTQILLDGVQVNQNGGFFDFQGLALSGLDRVEVTRGPQSALYGSSAVSGVVHFITTAGRPGPARIYAVAEGGGAAKHGGTARATFGASGGSARVQYALAGGGAYARGLYRLPHDTWARDGVIRLDAALGTRWSARGLLRHVAVESMLPVRDAGATRVPLDSNARNERDRIAASVTGEFRASANWFHRLGVSLYHEDFVYEDQFDGVASTGMYSFFVPDFTFAFNSALQRSAIEYSGTHQLTPTTGVWNVRVTYGARGEHERLTDRTSGDFGEGRLSLDRPAGAVFTEVHATVNQRLSVLAGTRFEKLERLAAEITPRATAVVDAIPRRLALRIATGRAYKAPNLQQQYLDNPFIVSNPNLQPETSSSWEVGIDVRSARDGITASGTFFRQRYSNLIRTVQLDSTRQINRNLGASRAQGIEIEARYGPSPRWVAGVSGSWAQTRILDNRGLPANEYPSGESLPFRPALLGTAFVEVSPDAPVTVLARMTYVGRQVVLTERFSGQRVELNAYALAGVTVTLPVRNGLTLYARADNVLDTHYNTAFDRPGAPLSVAVGARLSN